MALASQSGSPQRVRHQAQLMVLTSGNVSDIQELMEDHEIVQVPFVVRSCAVDFEDTCLAMDDGYQTYALM